MSKFPKVKWISNNESEKIAGNRKKYEKSWIKGICDRELNIIYLNTGIKELKYPVFYEIECLFHELCHFIFRHSKIDKMFDEVGLIIDIYLYNHSCKQNYRRKKKCK